MGLKIHHWIGFLFVSLVIAIISLIFKLCAQEIMQLVLAGATLLLAIGALESVKGNEKQFVSSKSPVLKMDLQKWNMSEYGDRSDKSLFTDEIRLNIKNVGFASAFNIRIIICERANKLYDVDLGNKISCFDLEIAEARQIKCICSDLGREHLQRPVIIKTEYIGILGNKMKQNFELPIQLEGQYLTAQTTYLDFGV